MSTGLALASVPPKESTLRVRRPVPASALPGRWLLKPSVALKPAERGARVPWYRGVHRRPRKGGGTGHPLRRLWVERWGRSHRSAAAQGAYPDEHTAMPGPGSQSGAREGKHRPPPLRRCSGRGSPPCKLAAGAQPVLPDAGSVTPSVVSRTRQIVTRVTFPRITP